MTHKYKVGDSVIVMYNSRSYTWREKYIKRVYTITQLVYYNSDSRKYYRLNNDETVYNIWEEEQLILADEVSVLLYAK